MPEHQGVTRTVVTATNAFSRSEQPTAVIDPADPTGVLITGTRVDNYDLGLGVSKKTVTGGTFNLNVADNVAKFHPGPAPLNPQARSALTRVFSEVAPFLGGGRSTPARRALESPIAMACLADRAPCFPSRM